MQEKIVESTKLPKSMIHLHSCYVPEVWIQQTNFHPNDLKDGLEKFKWETGYTFSHESLSSS